MDTTIAYLAGGRLHLKTGEDPTRTVESRAVVYTNGSAVYLIADGSRRRLCTDQGIEQVIVVGAPAPA